MKPTHSIFNKSIKTLQCSLTLALLLVFTQNVFAQPNVWTVDNRPESGSQYTSVQLAIDNVLTLDGDIIYIHPSPTSYGNISVTKRLKLVGPGHDPANSGGTRATLGTITLRANTTDSVITGLNTGSITAWSFGLNCHNIQIINNRVTGLIRGHNVAGNSNNWIIEGNHFEIHYSSAIINGSSSQAWQIRNNYIEGNLSSFDQTMIVTNNLFVQEDPSGTAQIFTSVDGITSPIVTNNMIIFTDPDITELINSGSTPVTYTNCLTWNAGEGVASDLVALPGFGNLDNADPLFTSIPSSIVDFYNNNYTLGIGSPAIGAATDSTPEDPTDIGVFGRNFPFDIHGRPHSMSYPEVMTILNTVVQPDQDLNVQFQATQKN
ncbi:MAG: hypothetical protein V7719_07960 [Psychroserpens sp.]|uniref:hypothetical protein n=1 Tax=Psychroserpens sp. TaxID=2020870 RepID=UPI003003928D